MDRKALNIYQRSLGFLEKAALIDLQDWWESGNRFDRSPADLLDSSASPFYALSRKYGDKAAVLAVDYLIMNRSLDDELRFLPRPTMAERASFEQVQKSLSWALNTSAELGKLRDKEAFKKMQGIMTRLVLNGARDTVLEATRRDGTRFARIPEPGACPFCLMLSSRGAVYTKDTVLHDQDMKRYHDHCRCIGMESTGGEFDGLPPVNRELREMWDANVGIDLHPHLKSEEQLAQWRNLIITKRRMKTGSDEAVRWPPINGITTPTYSHDARMNIFGKIEPLPDLQKMPGHVLFGWTDNQEMKPAEDNPSYGREAHTKGDRQGHRSGSIRKGASIFPETWSDQKVVDSVRDTIENPDEYDANFTQLGSRTVRKTIDGVTIEAKWVTINGKTKLIHAFPVRGNGVYRIGKNAKIQPIESPNAGNDRFKPVQ